VPGMQKQQRNRNEIQQRVLEPATASREELVKHKQDLADMFHAAEPSMRWFREQKKRLEPWKAGRELGRGAVPS